LAGGYGASALRQLWDLSSLIKQFCISHYIGASGFIFVGTLSSCSWCRCFFDSLSSYGFGSVKLTGEEMGKEQTTPRRVELSARFFVVLVLKFLFDLRIMNP
jgi:hypothetical protein